MTRADIVARLRAVVAADEAIERLRAVRAGGGIVHQSAWRGAYAARETADREAWGTHADDRAAFAREVLAVLEGN